MDNLTDQQIIELMESYDSIVHMQEAFGESFRKGLVELSSARYGAKSSMLNSKTLPKDIDGQLYISETGELMSPTIVEESVNKVRNRVSGPTDSNDTLLDEQAYQVIRKWTGKKPSKAILDARKYFQKLAYTANEIAQLKMKITAMEKSVQ